MVLAVVMQIMGVFGFAVAVCILAGPALSLALVSVIVFVAGVLRESNAADAR